MTHSSRPCSRPVLMAAIAAVAAGCSTAPAPAHDSVTPLQQAAGSRPSLAPSTTRDHAHNHSHPAPANTTVAVPSTPPSGSPATAASHAVSTGSGPTASRAPGLLAPPGHYTYRWKGQTTSSFGNRSLDGDSTLTVDAPQRNSQHSIDKGSDSTTEQTVVVQRGAVFLSYLRTSGSGFTVEFRPKNPVLLVPAHLSTGATWSWQTTSTDGKYTLTAHLDVERSRQPMTVDGRHLVAGAIKAHLVISGSSLQMTTDQLDRFAAGCPVLSEHAVSDGKAYGITFHTDSTRTLVSTRPS